VGSPLARETPFFRKLAADDGSNACGSSVRRCARHDESFGRPRVSPPRPDPAGGL